MAEAPEQIEAALERLRRVLNEILASRRIRPPTGEPGAMPGPEVLSLSALLLLRHAGFLWRPSLRVADHLDLEPDLFVIDPELGTIGLVHGLGTSAERSLGRESLARVVRRRIDQATYLRHLLLTAAGGEPAGAYAVECVLVVDDAVAKQPELGATLREIARETSFLDAIGINLLRCGPGGVFDESEQRRALSWLLHETRAWHGANLPPEASLHELTLVDYRLPGKRTWRPDPGARVHLLHGQNGTGKSSIAEALELFVTGRVERLRDEKDYARIIRNRHAQGDAQVTVRAGNGPARTLVVPAADRAEAMAPGFAATAFRLDQGLMDLLVRQRMPERIGAFKGFFPEDTAVWDAAAREDAELAAGCQALPASIQDAIDGAMTQGGKSRELIVRERFGWLMDAVAHPSLDQLADCLPVALEQLEALAAMSTDLRRCVEAWSAPPRVEELEEAAKHLDEALRVLRPQAAANHQSVEVARKALAELAGWTPQGQAGAADDFPVQVNRWLELSALADLADKHWQISRTLSGATAEGWQLSELTRAGLFADPSRGAELSELATLRTRWMDERDGLFTSLTAHAGPAAAPPGGTPPRRRLSVHEMRALDAVGPWLVAPGATPPSEPLGRVLDAALRNDAMATFGPLSLGPSGWAGPLGDTLAKHEAALLSVAAIRDDDPLCHARLGTLRKALEKAQLAQAAAENKVKTFLFRIGEGQLKAALNELMALFTPARWAYEDIAPSYREAAGQLRLDYETPDKQPADLRLNTAELTLFTLSLYLLCAVRARNPLGMLVLDDPLQNLDELTVTTLARGLARVVRVMPEGWRLLIMLHGEDNLDRFRREVPAAVYYLDWLLPTGARPASDGQDSEERGLLLDPRKSSPTGDFKDLAGLIKVKPPSLDLERGQV